MSGKPSRIPRVALLWHGDREARQSATLAEGRFHGVAEALGTVGIETEPAVYNDDFVHEVRAQLSSVDGVLVWVNPIEQGRDRTVLDAMLRQVSDAGVFVSTHPDTIQKLGTKEVLFRTQGMTWGCETHMYASAKELRDRLPLQLNDGKTWVLKQYRGNGGNGVWKFETSPSDPTLVRVRHALRGSVQQDMTFEEFLVQCEPYFAGAGRMIGQAYQDRLADGMVRCYLVGDTVVGFGHQAVNALFPSPPGASPDEAPQPGPRLYYPPTMPEFQAIKAKMETEWLEALRRTVDLGPDALPLLWDTDFLYGPKTESAEDTYVLCEINVSAVSPFPEEALGPLAYAVQQRLAARASHPRPSSNISRST